jgi:hypothetical protein
MSAELNPTLSHFRDALPYRPYCSDDLSTGLVIRGRDQALKHRYIQHSPPVLRCWLVFDIDRPGGVLAWEDADLPPPQISIRTPTNQHGQLLYGLLVPVCTSDAARQGPLRLAAAIERAYTELLEADRSYAGQIVKNPFHPDWATECWLRTLYELQELADWVDLDKYAPTRKGAEWGEWGLGRNCTLFARLGPEGKWAYREIRRYWEGPSRVWYDRVLSKALEWNGDFPVPLPHNEVRYLARSVARYTWKKFTPAQFRAIQTERGKRGGTVSGQVRVQKADHQRAMVRELREQGKSLQEIVQITGISERTAKRYLYEITTK